ncbi:MAG: SGNH/GDSL hydrolase family protein, partial [Candidatus Acidiferrum sp.]
LQKTTHEDVELYIRIVLAAVNLAKEKYGVATLIPYISYIPNGYLKGTGFSDDEIVRRLRDGGAMVVDVTLVEEKSAGAFNIKGDGHPTPLANRLRASIIKDYIENHIPGILVMGVH